MESDRTEGDAGGEGAARNTPDEAQGDDASLRRGGGSRGPPGIDPRTGEVSGGGSGAGGGNPGEDYDDDHTAGSNTAR